MIKNKTKTTDQKRDEISKYMGYISDSQIDLLYEIATLNRYSNKNELMKLANISEDDRRKIDTAYPHDYYNRIHDIFPNISQGNLVFDYREGYGQLVNVNDLIVSRILKSKT
tara:strand:+ start:527 stop:862 length:336 start_codon:yes stop_codon:yes gene_type:complete